MPSSLATDVTSKAKLNISTLQIDHTTGIVTQMIVITNIGNSAIIGPISMALDQLTNASLVNQSGKTQSTSPSGSPYINLALGTGGTLAVGQSVSVLLVFYDPSFLGITYTARLLAGTGRI